MLRTKKTKKKKDFDGEFDITPMIDVVLLLLIFFMVSARMAPQNVAKLPKAKNGDIAAMHDAVVLIVKSGSDSASVSTLAGRKFSSDKDVQSAEIAEYVEVAFQDIRKKYVLIQGEPKVLTSEMMRIQQAVGNVLNALGSGKEIMIAVEH
jgi:biopolymer transport protein ExbD